MSEHKWRVQVVSTCAGTGVCAATSPDRFTVVDNRSRPTKAEVPEGDEAVIAAAELCPMEAVVIRDATTGKPAWRPKD